MTNTPGKQMNKKRQTIYDKSGGLCWYCGCQLEKGWHADHFYPVVRVSGKMLYPELDSIENKVPSCGSCNMMKSSMNIEGFRSTITSFIESLNLYSTQYKFTKRYGLVKETKKTVEFWFEKNNLSVKSEQELCNISDEAMNIEWLRDKNDHFNFYIVFDKFICTLRYLGDHTIATAMDFKWSELGRQEFNNGRLTKPMVADWALKIQGNIKNELFSKNIN